MPTLRVRLVGAKSLNAADLDGSSDPYCILKLGAQTHKSKTEMKNLNPTWNQIFDFQVTNPHSEVLEIQVMDYDQMGGDDSLGTATVPLTDLVQGTEKSLTVPLKGGVVGENLMAMAQTEALKQFKNLLGGKKKAAAAGQQPHAEIKNKGQVTLGLLALDFSGAGGAPPGAGYGAPPGAGYGAPPGGGYGAPPGQGYGAPPGAGYGAPPGGGYGAPPGAYGAPGGYGAPPGGYGAPPGGYGAPPGGGYGAPPGAYGAPPPGGYGAPPGAYGAPYGSQAPPPGGYGAPYGSQAPPPGGYGAPYASHTPSPPPGGYGAPYASHTPSPGYGAPPA